jgi:hypothetical protein
MARCARDVLTMVENRTHLEDPVDQPRRPDPAAKWAPALTAIAAAAAQSQRDEENEPGGGEG